MDSFDELLERVYSKPLGTPVVVEPHTPGLASDVVNDVLSAGARAVLVGNEPLLRDSLRQAGIADEAYEVRPSESPESSAIQAAELVRSGVADFVVKGSISTAALLRVLLRREHLGTGHAASHLYLIEAPAYANRTIAFADAGVNIRPDVATKAAIIRNSATALRSMGIQRPLVAMLSAIELVKEAVASAVDAALVAAMAQRGQLGDVEVDGPLSLDAALSVRAAREKGLEGPVAGQAELLIAPDLDAANMTSKALIGECGRAMGVTVGTSVPIALPSRGDSLITRRQSLALASYLAHQQKS